MNFDEYTLLKSIGKGEFGEVYLTKKLEQTNYLQQKKYQNKNLKLL